MDCTGDIGGNWDFFKQSWNDYEHAIESDKKRISIRVASFHSILGHDAQRILLHLCLSDEQQNDLPTVISAPENHFKPYKNEVFERFLFNTVAQEPGEKIDAYVTRNICAGRFVVSQ